MAENRQKTMHEKWESDSNEKGSGLNFHDAPDTGERVELEGFSEEEMKRIMGEEEFKKYRQKYDEIDET